MEDSGTTDPRFDLTVDDECMDQLNGLVQATREFAKVRPLAAIRVCLEMQQAFRVVEQEAALRANKRYCIAWSRIGKALGHSSQWAWDRYIAGGLSHPKTRRKAQRA